MQKGVTGAAMLVSASDPDFTDAFGEASAIAKYLGEQREKNESELIRELAHVRGSGFGMTASVEKVEAETLDAIRSATETLTTKAPDEVAAYRALALGAAEHAANAKGGLAPGESAKIEKLKQALG
jgi:hypothetical protein